MQIDRILFPITSLGPGERLAIWTLGCSKHCSDCASPELWQCNADKEISVDSLISFICNSIGNSTDGVTITGGDPLEQPEELLMLVRALKNITSDILLYTGYTYEEIEQRLGCDYINELKKYICVMIDGRYISEFNDNKCVLRGSTNQRLFYFNDGARNKYEEYIAQGRKIQNVFFNDRIISVGIHNKD